MPALVLLFALTFAASPLWVPGFGGFDAQWGILNYNTFLGF